MHPTSSHHFGGAQSCAYTPLSLEHQAANPGKTLFWGQALLPFLMATLSCVSWATPPSPALPTFTAHVLTAEQSRAHEEAVAAFRSRSYAAAYGRFAALADTGHAPSAQAALFMFENGQQLFGSDWSASAPQLVRWEALQAQAPRVRTPRHASVAGD